MMGNVLQEVLYHFVFHVMELVKLVLALQALLVQAVRLDLSYIIQSATQIAHLHNISIQILLLVLLAILLA